MPIFFLFRDFVLREIGEITVNTFSDRAIQENIGLVSLHVPIMGAMDQILYIKLPPWHFYSHCACH